MMKKRILTPFEAGLWLSSVTLTTLSFLLAPRQDWLSLITSLIGATALIFVAKGRVLGQVLTVVFAVVYGVVSWHFRYYGEMLTYLGMTAPMAVLAAVEWLRHPYRGEKRVEVRRVTRRQVAVMLVLAVVVTGVFYGILRALGNARLAVSTLSVTTSFLASYLTFLRSPYYALGYAANDLVLIVLWVLAAAEDPAYLPMVACFVIFLANDLYGFVNWRRMQRQQGE